MGNRRDVAVIRLQHGKVNAIDEGFLNALNRALDAVSPSTGLVFTGRGNFFSVGLNLRYVYPLSREEMAAFMARFIATLQRVLTWPAPTVAALNGHTLGGGFLLALVCDRRVILPGLQARIGFPDVEKQVPLSYSLRLMARHALPASLKSLADGQGVNFSPEEAIAHGIAERVNEDVHLVPLGRPREEGAEQAYSRLVAAAMAWIAHQPEGYAAQKAAQQADLVARLHALGTEDIEYFLDQWFAPDTRRAFGRMWERLNRPVLID